MANFANHQCIHIFFCNVKEVSSCLPCTFIVIAYRYIHGFFTIFDEYIFFRHECFVEFIQWKQRSCKIVFTLYLFQFIVYINMTSYKPGTFNEPLHWGFGDEVVKPLAFYHFAVQELFNGCRTQSSCEKNVKVNGLPFRPIFFFIPFFSLCIYNKKYL